MRDRWLSFGLLLFIIFLMGAANYTTLPLAWAGKQLYSFPIAHSDVLHAQSLAFSTLDWTKVALNREGFWNWVMDGFWRAPAATAAYNQLDFILWVWPLRSFLEVGPALTMMHIGLLVLALPGGWVLARLSGCGPLGATAGALVAAGSGALVQTLQQGQYPQAMLFFPLCTLGLLAAHWQRWWLQALLMGGMSALCALLYWQEPVIIGLGIGIFWLCAWYFRQLPSGGWKAVALAAGIAALLCLPSILPMVQEIQRGNQELKMEAWGSPLAAIGQEDFQELSILRDEVHWASLIDPRSGWLLPALPLIPFLMVGLRRRSAWPWMGMALLGALLCLGPSPKVGENRHHNPVYRIVHQWVPTASRMRHPLRYGVLCTAGLVVIVGMGAEELAQRRARLSWVLIGGGALWTALVGGWPLQTIELPSEALEAIEPCTRLRFLGGAVDTGMSQRRLLAALSWKPMVHMENPMAMAPLGNGDCVLTLRGSEIALHTALTIHPPIPITVPPFYLSTQGPVDLDLRRIEDCLKDTSCWSIEAQ